MAGGLRGFIMVLVALAATAPLGARAQTVDLALVLAVDVSRSIDDDEFQLQRRGYAEAFRNPAVITAIRGTPHGTIAVTFVEWAGAEFQRVVVPWTVISDAESGQIFADAVQREPRDARVLLEAALAAGDGAAAQPARDWLKTSRFEDAQLRQLGQATAALPAFCCETKHRHKRKGSMP